MLSNCAPRLSEALGFSKNFLNFITVHCDRSQKVFFIIVIIVKFVNLILLNSRLLAH
jgi:hypothetical protein